MTNPEVTQEDREAAIPILRRLNEQGVINSVEFAEFLRQAFARHRIAALSRQSSLPVGEVEAIAKAIGAARQDPPNQDYGLHQRLSWDEQRRAATAALSSLPVTKTVEYCSNCTCDFCQKRQQDEANRKALSEDSQARCWSCSCGWIGCYTQADIAEHEEPSECQKCYRERLEECDPLRVNATLPALPVSQGSWEEAIEAAASYVEAQAKAAQDIVDLVSVQSNIPVADPTFSCTGLRQIADGIHSLTPPSQGDGG